MTETLRRTKGRTSAVSVPSLEAISTISCTAASEAITCLTRGSRRRVSASMRINQATLSSSLMASSGSMGRYRRCVKGRCQALTPFFPPLRAIARAASEASSNAGNKHFVGVRKAGFLAADGAHADALFDAVRALLDDAILERPGLLARQRKVQIRVIHAAAHDGVEHLAQAPLIETGRREDRLLGHRKALRNQFGAACVHVATAARSATPS